MTIYPVPKPVRAKRTRAPLRRTKMQVGVALPKPVRIREPEYRAWISRHRCVVENKIPADRFCESCDGWMDYAGRVLTDCAHVRGKGAGGGDEQCVPLCGKHHRWGKHSLHKLNVEAFDKYWGVKLRKIARELRRQYLREAA